MKANTSATSLASADPSSFRCSSPRSRAGYDVCSSRFVALLDSNLHFRSQIISLASRDPNFESSIFD